MLKILLKITAEEFKSPLPVDLRRSKTSWLKTLSSVFTNTLLSWSLEQLVWVGGGAGGGVGEGGTGNKEKTFPRITHLTLMTTSVLWFFCSMN